MLGWCPKKSNFVLKQVQSINNEIWTGIYLFMIAFKSPIMSYTHFFLPICQKHVKSFINVKKKKGVFPCGQF